MSIAQRNAHRGAATRPRRRAALVAVALVASVCSSTVVAVVAPGVASAGTGASGLGYTPVTPCRVVSTTSGTPIAAGEIRSFRVAGSGTEFATQGGTAGGCGIPDGVPAVSVSISAVSPAANGFLRVFPATSPEPNATFLNYTDGTGITNTGAVKLATTGSLDLKISANGGATDVVVDVQGYFSASSAVNYKAISPCRVFSSTAGASTPFAPGDAREIQVAGTGANFAAQGGKAGGCSIPDGAAAVEVSVTAVDPTAAGFVRTAKAGTADAAMKGTVLNYTSAQNITNTATLDLAPSGAKDLKIRNSGGTTDIVVDVQGYYSSTNTGRFVPITPCRVLNTKARDARLPANGARGVRVTGTVIGFAAQGLPGTSTGCGIDDDASAVMASVTAVDPDSSGFVRSWPIGSFPTTATMLNYADGRPVTNTGALATGTHGDLDLGIRNFSGSTDLVIDVQGYFANSADQRLLKGLAASAASSCAYSEGTLTETTVRCWGSNSLGQLGNNTVTNSSTPTDTQTFFGSLLLPYVIGRSVTGGRVHFCALTLGQDVNCWGGNEVGQLGSDTGLTRGDPKSVVPKAVNLLGDDAINVDAGKNTTCVVIENGTARCWGEGSEGELGNGGSTDSLTPVTVSGVEDAVQITTNAPSPGAGAHSCALRETGTVLCWGSNEAGQLGTGTTTSSKVPVAVAGLAGVTEVAAGSRFTCAIVRGGGVRCWGFGASGELGNGAATSSPTPVAVSLPEPAMKIAAGSSFACALLVSSQVRCWGSGGNGRIGNGAENNTPTPAFVSSLTVFLGVIKPLPIGSVVDIALGSSHACAMSSNGSARCWGFNSSGQLGNGTTTPFNNPRPVSVSGLP